MPPRRPADSKRRGGSARDQGALPRTLDPAPPGGYRDGRPRRFPVMTPCRLASLVSLLVLTAPAVADDRIELQPLAAQARRVADALDLLGAPLPQTDKAALLAAADEKDADRGVKAIEVALDKHCLAEVTLGPAVGSNLPPLSVRAGAVKPELAEQGWRVFLVKVRNPEGIGNAELRVDSPNGLPLTRPSGNGAAPTVVSVGEVGKRFLDVMTFT